jgi:hypothetical protein
MLLYTMTSEGSLIFGGVRCGWFFGMLGILGEIGSELLYFVFGIVGVIWGLWMLVVTPVESYAGIRILRR